MIYMPVCGESVSKHDIEMTVRMILIMFLGTHSIIFATLGLKEWIYINFALQE